MIESREQKLSFLAGVNNGDIIELKTETNCHFGIYVGSGMVVNLKKSITEDGKVRRNLFSTVCMDNIVEFEKIHGKKKVVKLNGFGPKFGIFYPQRPEKVVHTALQELDSRTSLTERQFVEKCVYGCTLSLSKLLSAPAVAVVMIFLSNDMNYASTSIYAMYAVLVITGLTVIFSQVNKYITEVLRKEIIKYQNSLEDKNSNSYIKSLQENSNNFLRKDTYKKCQEMTKKTPEKRNLSLKPGKKTCKVSLQLERQVIL